MSASPSASHHATVTELFNSSYWDLVRVIVETSKRPADAEGIAQEAFIKVSEYLEKGGELTRPFGFLWVTARNIMSSRYRLKAKRATHFRLANPRAIEEIAEEYKNLQAQPLDESVFYGQELHRICELICSLDSRYQEAFVRRRVFGQTMAEIAAAMNIKPSAASNYVLLGWNELSDLCAEKNISLKENLLGDRAGDGRK